MITEKKDGELKSQTMKTKDFSIGFASLNNHTIEFYEDLKTWQCLFQIVIERKHCDRLVYLSL